MSQTTTPGLLSIGAFSRRSRLSQKALRMYDQLSLLRPARVDEWTGYRYYTEDQIAKARLIGLLRRLEMPLQRIATVVELPAAEAVAALGAYWAEVEASVAVKRRLVAHLERHLEGRGEAMFDVATRQVPEQRVLTLQRALTVESLPTFIQTAGSQLYEHLTEAGAKPGTMFVAYHGEVNHDSDGPVEVCVPFERTVEPAGEMVVRNEPAHEEAYTTITLDQCEFPGILDAYAAVERWIRDQGREMAASPREVYFAEVSQVRGDDPFCDIAFPIA